LPRMKPNLRISKDLKSWSWRNWRRLELIKSRLILMLSRSRRGMLLKRLNRRESRGRPRTLLISKSWRGRQWLMLRERESRGRRLIWLKSRGLRGRPLTLLIKRLQTLLKSRDLRGKPLKRQSSSDLRRMPLT